jgi:pimeloyl-ACP methyl ester carboxylesterase
MSTVELAFTESGAGRPVILLHAFPLMGAMFAEQQDRLSDRARVVVPDLRGFGESPGSAADAPASVDVMADDVAALLDRLTIDTCVIGGISMGGYVAMAMLRRHRDRVAAVVLMDTKATADDEAAKLNRERIAQATLEHGSRALRPMLDTLVGPTTRNGRPAVMTTVTSWIESARPESVAWAQRAMAGRPDSAATLATADVPGFVIVGEEDHITGHDDALAMASAFTPPAPVHVIPGAGHLSAVENPAAVTSALADVLRHV